MSTEEQMTETAPESGPAQQEPDFREKEKQEIEKLKVKYPAVGQPMAGHSAFLSNRLARGQKYFDSGDYQMAKQSKKGSRAVPSVLPATTEQPLATPDVVHARKPSVPSKLASN